MGRTDDAGMEMKTIGLIGGMSWESSALYYRIVNEEVKRRLGGLHAAEVVLLSLDFAPIERLQAEGRWDEAGARLAEAARRVERAGADLLLLCTNTMHRVAVAVAAAVGIPLLHIADPTAVAITAAGISRVGLLGTRFTMEQDFYRGRLADRHGLDVLVPGEHDRRLVHDVIYRELVLGEVRESSRDAYRAVMARLVGRGAEAIILGCTEIVLLVRPEDATVPLFDTTRLHAEGAVALALGGVSAASRPLVGGVP
ncbi:MAG: Aspartate racemase [uncultured Thermomicrobiales bacterium]|uniref:Aspartate racemase n=1 Tax=uncultured Thermomicrobiales bacterium TaxID=1645740 RepID=A0A6J4UX03_9BACT|nr:MAG: Aspartate racemase [uncultured Thermomicrobiales bacterium]